MIPVGWLIYVQSSMKTNLMLAILIYMLYHRLLLLHELPSNFVHIIAKYGQLQEAKKSMKTCPLVNLKSYSFVLIISHYFKTAGDLIKARPSTFCDPLSSPFQVSKSIGYPEMPTLPISEGGSLFFKHFCQFWHPNLATSLFLASFVPLELDVILKTSLFLVWILFFGGINVGISGYHVTLSICRGEWVCRCSPIPYLPYRSAPYINCTCCLTRGISKCCGPLLRLQLPQQTTHTTNCWCPSWWQHPITHHQMSWKLPCSSHISTDRIFSTA